MARRKSKVRVEENYPEWRPWGLFDDKTVPKVSEEAITDAIGLIDQLGGGINREWLERRIQAVAIEYAANRTILAKPPLEWYRRRIEPMRRATAKLLETIEASSNDVKFWSFRSLVIHGWDVTCEATIPSGNPSNKH
jgi:hypothetical protein